MNKRITELNKIAFSYTKDTSKAEDAVSDALLNFLEAYPDKDFESDDSLPLLVTILKNQIIDDTRKKRETIFSDLEIEDENGEFKTFEPIGTAGDTNYDDIITMIKSLKPKLREAADLVYLKGLTYAEASDALGITEAALTSRLYKARKIISKELED